MSWDAPFPLREGEDLDALKMRYAELRAKFPLTAHTDLVLGILSGSPESNVGRAFQAVQAWEKDFDVLEAIQAFRRNGSTKVERQPEKEAFAQEIIDYARSETDGKNKIEALKLYANIKGFIEKPGVTVNNNTLTINKVMRIPAASSNDEWEERLKKQQAQLVNVTPTNH